MTACPPGIPILNVTDGTIVIDLLARGFGITLEDWTPSAPSPKGGGVFVSSPFLDGRRLVDRKLDNIIDSFGLKLSSPVQDTAIRDMRALRNLLVKATRYWTTSWQKQPVWIEARGPRETNTRYAVIKDYRMDNDDNPYAMPFFGPTALIDEITMVIEHGLWQDFKPGDSECLPLSISIASLSELSVEVPASGSDGYVSTFASTFDNGGANMFIGRSGGWQQHAFIRLANVTIPQGAQIVGAQLYAYHSGNNPTPVRYHWAVYGEDADNPAAVSSYADFFNRARTTAFATNELVGTASIGSLQLLGNVTQVVQEIVNRVGFASGNAMQFFIQESGTEDIFAISLATFDHATLDPAYLEIQYVTGNSELDSSCVPFEIFVANKQNAAQITDIFRFDASVPSYTQLIGTALPYELLPSPISVGDILYFGSTAGPFNSSVVDIGTPGTTYLGVWEYSQGGAAWASETVDDNSAAAAARPFSLAGIHSLHWSSNPLWVQDTVNGVLAHWIRFRVTSGGGTVPTQQNRDPYTLLTAAVSISGADVGGDEPALLRLHLGSIGGNSDTTFYIYRAIMGLRTLTRGPGFSAYINFSDEQNVPDVTSVAVGDATVTFEDDPKSSTGRVIRFNPAAATAYADILGATIQLSESFYGNYHAFLRVKCSTVGDFDKFTFNIRALNGTVAYFDSGLLSLPDTSTATVWNLIDVGHFSIPAGFSELSDGEISNFSIQLRLNALSDASPSDLFFNDLILIPVDEWAGDFFMADLASSTAEGLKTNLDDELIIDSLGQPSSRIRARKFKLSTGEFDASWAKRTIGEAIAQSSIDQKLWVLLVKSDNWTIFPTPWHSNPEQAVAVWAEKIQRYHSMRGQN